MIKFLIPIFALLWILPAGAVVDMKNSNFADSWTDLTVPGSGYELRIKRTYNSRSLFNGLFGYGWCSDYETKLEVTAENGLRLTECGGGLQITYSEGGSKPGELNSSVQKILSEIKIKNSKITPAELKNLEKDLKNDQYLRIAFVKRLNLEGKVVPGKVYKANGREAESIVLKDSVYQRTLPNGTNQRFNLSGQLTHMYDKNGNYIKITYSKDLISKIADNSGRQLNFHYIPGSTNIKYITGPGGLKAEYKFNKEDLIWAKNQWKVEFKYKYDNLHNLTRIDFPSDKTYKELTYNQDRDWVTSFRNRKGCIETYDYKINKKAKYDHYWSSVVKKCKNKITNKSKYEFKYMERKDTGGSYLYKVASDVNGDKTEIYYHAIFGKPLKLVQNGLITTYKYHDNGFVKFKKEPYRHFTYAYDKNCSKVSSVKTRYYGRFEKGKKRKPLKMTKSLFSYDKNKCNLKMATNSDGQKVILTYDVKGRISKIVDQSKKKVLITYEDRFGMPKTVNRPGLGSITVNYKTTGEIDKVDSKEGPRVAVQVANVFNNLLELISPATTDLSL